jgi:hypothetical protein
VEDAWHVLIVCEPINLLLSNHPVITSVRRLDTTASKAEYKSKQIFCTSAQQEQRTPATKAIRANKMSSSGHL